MDTEKYKFNYSYPIQIRLSDLDPLGHVNNGIQYFYYDIGRIHYLEKIIGNNISFQEIDMVVVHTACDFMHSIRENEKICVESKIIEFGNKSINMIQRIINIKTKEIKSTCQTVLSGYDRVNDCSKIISDEFKRKAACFENEALNIK